jgi:hypothetical protein
VLCRNLCHQAIFVDYASGAVASPDTEVVQVGDSIWQRAQRRGLVQGAVRVVEVLVLAQDGHQVALHDPGLDGMPGGAKNTDPADAVLDDGKDIDLAAVEKTSREEVQRQDPLRLGPQELRLARAIPARRGIDPCAV